MTEKELETKTRIINASRVLFAEKGFEGTTIRDISGEAGVNVASINYYFSSKEKLFEEVLLTGYEECSLEVGKMFGPDKKLEDSVVELFRFFQARSHDLLSQFKLMMRVQDKEKFVASGDQMLGPPGWKNMTESIIREVGRPISEEDLHWALKTLFSHVTHISIVSTCCFKTGNIPFSSVEDIEKGIRRVCRLVLADLK